MVRKPVAQAAITGCRSVCLTHEASSCWGGCLLEYVNTLSGRDDQAKPSGSSRRAGVLRVTHKFSQGRGFVNGETLDQIDAEFPQA